MIVMKPLFLPSFSPVLLSCITWSEPSTIPGPAALGTAPHAAALLLAPAEWPWDTGWHAAPLSSWHNSSTSVSRKFNTDQKTAGRRVGHCHSPFTHRWLGSSPGGLGWLVGIASTRASHFKGGKRGVPGAPQAHSREGEDGTLGIGCSVTPGSCCRAPDLAHTSSLAINQGKGEIQSGASSGCSLPSGSRIQHECCPAAACSFNHPPEFRQRPPGSDACGDKGPRALARHRQNTWPAPGHLRGPF